MTADNENDDPYGAYLRKEITHYRYGYAQWQRAKEANRRADALARELAKSHYMLERVRNVLGNMAMEREGAIFRRWPIHHEPLRHDARNLLPLIDEIIGETDR